MLRCILFFLITCFSLIACQKEISLENGNGGSNNNGGGGSTSNASLVGTWKFNGMHVETMVENIVADPALSLRTVTKAVYNTKQNTGTYNFTSDLKAVSINLGYSVDTTSKGYIYENNVLQDSMEIPLSIPYFTSSSSSAYKLIGTDSIFFSGGTLSIGTTTQPTEPVGMKYKIAGNTLTMSYNVMRDSSFIAAGTEVRSIQKAATVMTLIK
ncbi:MAG: hypothetical protein V4717_11515 [Bacteroidota bacterium]